MTTSNRQTDTKLRTPAAQLLTDISHPATALVRVRVLGELVTAAR